MMRVCVPILVKLRTFMDDYFGCGGIVILASYLCAKVLRPGPLCVRGRSFLVVAMKKRIVSQSEQTL